MGSLHAVKIAEAIFLHIFRITFSVSLFSHFVILLLKHFEQKIPLFEDIKKLKGISKLHNCCKIYRDIKRLIPDERILPFGGKCWTNVIVIEIYQGLTVLYSIP